jgi:NAD(P)-dependent dehydrogenase (short-subunit alcohol dehydrogenase family)
LERIDALAAATRLVGMIHPGLYSILGGIEVRLTPGDEAGVLGFEMGELRHGQIDAAIAGGGIVGVLDCRVPFAPVTQESSLALREMVTPGRYAGARVLVVGGSRGAGEATAKLLALGGADVTITYRDGAPDAEAVARDIIKAGGSCTVRRYDAAEPAEAQLGDLSFTHACWFATPVMTSAFAKAFDEDRLEECLSVLVTGFWALATALHKRRSDVRLFYPSTNWIGLPPRGLIEYCMAKAAGEVLARSLEETLPGTRVIAPRLAPMMTDQTARIGIEAKTANAEMITHLDTLISPD